MRHSAVSILAVVFLIAIARADNDPKAIVRIVFDEAYQSPRDLPAQIADELRRDLIKRGSTRRIEFIESDGAAEASADAIVISIVRSDWAVKKAFSIPYLLNRYKSVYRLKINIEAEKSDGPPLVAGLSVEKETGAEAQLLTNDMRDPDLQIGHSRRLEMENEAASEMGKKLARKLWPIIK